jgi:ribosomal protein S18 acetylase RimI-like enzyme
MYIKENIKITFAEKTDLPEILAIQRLAFEEQCEIYGNYHIPPMVETVDEALREFENKLFLKAICNSEIVGSVRAYKKENTCYIERLSVAPRYQGNGIGSVLMLEIEKRFADTHIFKLFTGEKSDKNIRIYEKIGYEIYETRKGKEGINLVFMIKQK